VPVEAQLRVAPVDLEQGHVALGLALRHLGNTGIYMMATAHPDDENNGLLVMLNRGLGYRTALATATRGNGGQNEIGPELFEALGVLRTEELHAIHRFDGAEQYFTRAVDFGFSFSIEETYEKWGREEIIADYVRLIRTIRPDVITALNPTGNGGGQHHQASALLAREAFRAAGDARRFPDQIAAGLRPWRPRKFYFAANVGYGRGGPPAAGQLTLDIGGFDTLLGRTWAEIGGDARSMHKCQGTDQLQWLPGPATASFSLVDSTLGPVTRAESSLFDGIDTSIAGLAQLASPRAPIELVAGLETIATRPCRPRRCGSAPRPMAPRWRRCSPGSARRGRCAPRSRRCRWSPHPSTRSTSGSRRKSASSRRPSCSPAGCASTCWPPTRSSCRDNR
jgi:LmbE family N-acetylglucosaminyl deacetylase